MNIYQCIQRLMEGKMDEAEHIRREVLTNGTDDERYALAEELQNLGFLEEALELYEKVLENNPEEGGLLVSIAEVYIDMNNEDEALVTLEKMDRNDPAYVEALLLLADLYEAQGLFEVSEQKLLEAEKLAPEEPVIQFALAEIGRASCRERV